VAGFSASEGTDGCLCISAFLLASVSCMFDSNEIVHTIILVSGGGALSHVFNV